MTFGLGVPAAVLASAFPSILDTRSAQARQRTSLQSAKASTFSRHLGDTFRVYAGPLNVVETKLIEVTDHSKRSFSTVFHGPLDSPLPQDTYTFEHDSMGEFPLFIVPIAPDTGGLYYEAVFNRENG
jgi:hypothetical protein